jgi:hypothetical protein
MRISVQSSSDLTGGVDMTRNVSERGTGHSRPDGAGSSEDGEEKKSFRNLGRRTLLTRGGVVAAGVVGAGAVATVVAGPAAAASGNPILQDTVNSAGSSATVTELDADNDTAPAFILTNTGQDSSVSTTSPYAAPNVRLTPSTATGVGPTVSTVGGDLTATSDGNLWFTHFIPSEPAGSQIFPAPVHTEANSNVFAGLPVPVRVLDTRSSALRANVLNPTVLNSNGTLPSTKTLYLNLDSLVIFADTVFANVTVTATTAAGFLTLWSGTPATNPTSSNINWNGANVTIANFTAVALDTYPVGATGTNITAQNVLAIFAATTTHIILDVVGFTTPGYEYLISSSSTSGVKANSSRVERLARAQAKLRAANSTSKS